MATMYTYYRRALQRALLRWGYNMTSGQRRAIAARVRNECKSYACFRFDKAYTRAFRPYHCPAPLLCWTGEAIINVATVPEQPGVVRLLTGGRETYRVHETTDGWLIPGLGHCVNCSEAYGAITRAERFRAATLGQGMEAHIEWHARTDVGRRCVAGYSAVMSSPSPLV